MILNRPLENFVGGKIKIDLYDGGAIEVELQELLGAGNFGSVWKTIDPQSNKFYTLKIFENFNPNKNLAKRFRLEAEIAIPSEYIICSIGFRQWDDCTYLILFEYFPGIPLQDYLARYSLNPEQKRSIFQQILIAVGDAHRCNIIHQDLKPANILVGEDNTTIKVIDFGMAKFKEEILKKSDRAIFDSYPWMAPEILLEGTAIADAKVDIYALGHIFYQMATGQHFWVHQGWGLNGFEKFVRDYLQVRPMPEEAIDLRDFKAGFYDNSRDLLARMVKIDPKKRFKSIDQILDRLGYASYQTPILEDLHVRYPLLIVESGSNKGAKTIVSVGDRNKVILGRFELAGNDLSISRKHLEISREGDRYFAKDLGSRNGTLLRGNSLKPEDPPAEIKHCDRIKVGDIFLRFVFLRNF
ncbi:MAG: FHA domain-containing serine/threonine-protein kinase [Prochloraceae cyanobacterium]|nr:FHA domain-containing serine/threonine-protein kinase [Prochloraceae cyanobacterium]